MTTFDQPVLLVGAGKLYKQDKIQIKTLNYPIICADGGAAHIQKMGLEPVAVVGDLDSVDRSKIASEKLIHDSDQNTTDFEKTLSAVAAPLKFCFGFWGKRLDHSLAALTALTRADASNAILFGKEDLCFCATSDVTLDLAPKTPIAFFPLSDVTAKSTGLKYPLDGLHLSPTGRIATSNQTTGPVRVSDIQGTLLTILPRDQLPAVTAAMGINILAG